MSARRRRRGDAALQVRPPAVMPNRPSIAVLPFTNLSGDPTQAYFADGMVDDIVAGLSRIKWLFVIARSTMSAYKARASDAQQIGRDLGVRYLLEGSIRASSGRLRIAARLVDTESAGHVWAERYDRTLQDVFALQDEVALARRGRHRAESAARGGGARAAPADGQSRRLRSGAALAAGRGLGDAGAGDAGPGAA